MHSMMLISFCTKSGDAGLCPAAEDNSLSSYMEISGSILFSNAVMCALLPSVDAPPLAPPFPHGGLTVCSTLVILWWETHFPILQELHHLNNLHVLQILSSLMEDWEKKPLCSDVWSSGGPSISQKCPWDVVTPWLVDWNWWAWVGSHSRSYRCSCKWEINPRGHKSYLGSLEKKIVSRHRSGEGWIIFHAAEKLPKSWVATWFKLGLWPSGSHRAVWFVWMKRSSHCSNLWPSTGIIRFHVVIILAVLVCALLSHWVDGCVTLLLP